MGSKSPWIKLGILILLIITFIVFKKFNKKSEGFAITSTISIYKTAPSVSIFLSGCADSTGNMFIGTQTCVYKIDTNNNMTLFAGSVTTSGTIDGTATNARFNTISGMATDSSNNLYIAEYNNYRVRKISSTGDVTTLTATGFQISSTAKPAVVFSSPVGVAVDSSQNLYVCEFYNIKKITSSGAVSTYMSMPSTGTVAFGGRRIAIDRLDNLYYTKTVVLNNITTNYTLYKHSITTNSIVYSIGSGIGCTDGTNPSFQSILGLNCDSFDNLYLCDFYCKKIRMVDTNRNVTTIAGNGTGGNTVGSPATTIASIEFPVGIIVRNNKIYIIEGAHIKELEILTTCGVGQYVSGSSCASCPAGTSQNSATFTGTSCSPCAAGTYSGAGATTCTACPMPAGATAVTSPASSTSSGACKASSCSAGYYLNNGVCTSCAAGSSSTAGSTTCTTCGVGTYSAGTAGSCTSCGAGKYTTGTGSTSASACLSVPVGGTLNSSGTGFTCAAGYSQGATSCTLCGAGTYSAAGATSCSACGSGTYSAAGASNCSPLPTGATASSSGTGFTCGAGYSQGTTACTICGVGTYSAAGATTCTSCGAGKYTTTTGSSNVSACLSVPVGGTLNPAGNGYVCNSGYYNNGTTCAALPSNATVNSSGTGFTCVAGYSQSATACAQCGVGTYSAAGATSCSACGSGTYSAAGAASCTPLPPNAIATNTGLGFTCAPGFYNNGTGCTALPSNATASSSGTGFTCAAGYSQGTSICTVCGVGTYSGAGATTCTACGAGKYTTSNGSTSASNCLSPPTYGTVNSAGNGFVCNSGYYNNGTTCSNLPSNATANSSGTGFTCAAGYSQGATACTQCGVGTYSAAGATTCSACGSGTYSVAGASNCSPLPTGASASSSGSGFTCGSGYSQGTSSCTQCGVGTYSGAGATSCTNCALTTGASVMTSTAGSSSQSNCTATSCQPGYGFAAGNCTQCGAGFFGSGGTTTCIACSGGLTSPVGSSSPSQCICPTGQLSVTLNEVTKCVVNCENTGLPPRTQGSKNGTLFAIKTCRPGGTNEYNYTLGSNVITTNPCTGQAFYDFDKQACVNALGTEVTATSSNVCDDYTVYSQETNACVPVRIIVKPGDPQLKNTTGQPGTNDYRSCKTVDQGDCTLIFDDGTGNYTTTNPCTASGKLYNFATKRCSTAVNPCCRFTSPAAAAAGGCVNDTQTIFTKNPVKCPPGSKVLCCNQASSTNRSCQTQGYWTNVMQFTANHNTTCASGFMNFGDGIDSIAQKRARRLLKI
jgi:hypothetical protein